MVISKLKCKKNVPTALALVPISITIVANYLKGLVNNLFPFYPNLCLEINFSQRSFQRPTAYSLPSEQKL